MKSREPTVSVHISCMNCAYMYVFFYKMLYKYLYEVTEWAGTFFSSKQVRNVR